MIPPPYHNPSFIDLNEDQPQHDDHIFNNLNPQVSSSLTLSYQPQEDQGEFFYREQQRFEVLQVSLEADHKIVSSGGSCDLHTIIKADQESESADNNDLKLRIWKNDIQEKRNDDEKHNSSKYIDDSVKWTSSKMRMMRKMIITNTDRHHHHHHHQTSNTDDDHHHHRHHGPINFTLKLDNHQIMKNNKHDLTSPFRADHHSSSSSSNLIDTNVNNNGTIRVCSDCNTTKTPLWRSGPRGPKSLCNACGIRQRKARRAMAAAAAAANGTIAVVDAASTKNTSTKIQHKVKKSKIAGSCGNPQFKKRSCKLAPPSRGRKKLLCFEDLRISMSKSSAFQRVFPQDEKDAAILLMALSYGLVHG